MTFNNVRSCFSATRTILPSRSHMRVGLKSTLQKGLVPPNTLLLYQQEQARITVIGCYTVP
jgi:hypothetical protein